MTKPERKRPAAASVRPKLEAKREGIFTGSEDDSETAQPSPPPAKAATKKPVTFSADVELMDRARAAVLLSQSQPNGYRSLAGFIVAAVEDKLRAAADEFNDGQPIEPLTGTFRLGRPFQS
jgi:hypothetical protein